MDLNSIHKIWFTMSQEALYTICAMKIYDILNAINIIESDLCDILSNVGTSDM